MAGSIWGKPPIVSARKIQLQKTGHIEIVKVGLLIPESDKWLAAKHGTEMAIAEENANGGYGGHRFELIVRSIAGLWGSGSKEIVKLVFEDSVWAILGSLDGRSAHLAEQIATKGRIVLVSSWATDPTLTQINIPWFFRCVPDDRQQARALMKEIFEVRQLKQVATVAGKVYDARMAATSFSQIVESEGYQAPLPFSYETASNDFQSILNKIEQTRVDAVVLFGPSKPTAKFVQQMRARGMKQDLFGSLSLLADNELLNLAGMELEQAVFIAPGFRYTSKGKSFQKDFQNIYGYPPTAVAAYAYDGMHLILEAIRKSGFDKEKIRDTLANIDYPQGVTGSIRFDANGNRVGPVNLIEIIKGRPIIYISRF